MNKAISLREMLPNAHKEIRKAEELLMTAKQKLHRLERDIASNCTHRKDDGTSALRFNSIPMTDRGTCEICGMYIETEQKSC
ncbi:hypothetical protein CN918_29980 [Priestia megaterium]|nr:hypothetical protein CN918_29980 [Priestia megaterium]